MSSAPADTVVLNANVTTLVDASPSAEAFAVRGEQIVAVGTDAEIMVHAGNSTQIIDAGGRRVIPGLNDSHLHAIRGALMFNLELRWDGVTSLERGLEMVAEQAQRTPADQWVRVMGGWSPYQFAERRMPTIAELNAAAPEIPVLILFGYSAAFLNAAAVARIELSPASTPPPGGHYDFTDEGVVVTGNLGVYGTIARLPSFTDAADQLSGTQHFLRELNRFGMTSAVDAGESNTTYPDDYAAVRNLADEPAFPVRLSNFLFAQQAGAEYEAWAKWTVEEHPGVNQAASRLHGYVLRGAGEMLTMEAHDFENFMAPRPEWGEEVKARLAKVTEVIARHQWPIRMHATYDETITQILDVFEKVFDDTGYTGRWAIDHAETIRPRNIERIRALGGGIAIQNRLAFSGEFFSQRYGVEAAAAVSPLRQIIDAGVPLGAGTDATRPSSYNPWLSLYWMVTGRTLGGEQLSADDARPSRKEALKMYTQGSAWFSGEEKVKGLIAPGQYADFAVLSDDYLTVSDEAIRSIESVLTVTGGDIVYAAAPFAALAPAPLPAVSPAWSPVSVFGGYQQSAWSETGGVLVHG